MHQHFCQQHLLGVGFGEMLVQVSAQATEFFDAGDDAELFGTGRQIKTRLATCFVEK